MLSGGSNVWKCPAWLHGYNFTDVCWVFAVVFITYPQHDRICIEYSIIYSIKRCVYVGYSMWGGGGCVQYKIFTDYVHVSPENFIDAFICGALLSMCTSGMFVFIIAKLWASETIASIFYTINNIDNTLMCWLTSTAHHSHIICSHSFWHYSYSIANINIVLTHTLIMVWSFGDMHARTRLI